MSSTKDSSQQKTKKRRQQLWREIPTNSQYHVSYMHRDVVTHAVHSPKHGYVVTASQDGVVKFWKRISVAEESDESSQSQSECLEFVKSFTAHVGALVNLQVSHEGDTVVSVGVDRVVKVYDVSTFDVTGMIKINPDQGDIIGPAVVLVDSLALALDGRILVYALDTLSLLNTVQLHAAPITAMVFNPLHQCVLSTDRKGIVELWNASDGSSTVNGVTYTSKSETDLYVFCQKKTFCLTAATSGAHYALYGANGILYLLHHATGKVVVKFDERSKVYDESFSTLGMDALEYGKRAATEREMAQESPIFGSSEVGSDLHQSLSLTFDGTGNFLLVPTMVGIKVLDWARRKVVKIVGKDDASELRFLTVCLCEGDAKVNQQMQMARSSSGPQAAMEFDKVKMSDALIVTCAYQKRRMYVFSHKQQAAEEHEENRDVLNEPPTAEDRLLGSHKTAQNESSKLGSEAILRTSMGDIHMKLFFKEVPRTIENFCTHARNGYYDGVIFHRVIPNFMLQTGDPLGDGTGGESVWGGEFEDEFVRELRHDRPFTVSMANAGPSEYSFLGVMR